MSRCSTPEPDNSPDALRRFQYPWEYPCFNLVLDGVYKPMSGCRERCCMLPPRAPGRGTPEGEDTPKWKATLIARQEGASP